MIVSEHTATPTNQRIDPHLLPEQIRLPDPTREFKCYCAAIPGSILHETCNHQLGRHLAPALSRTKLAVLDSFSTGWFINRTDHHSWPSGLIMIALCWVQADTVSHMRGGGLPFGGKVERASSRYRIAPTMTQPYVISLAQGVILE